MLPRRYHHRLCCSTEPRINRADQPTTHTVAPRQALSIADRLKPTLTVADRWLLYVQEARLLRASSADWSGVT